MKKVLVRAPYAYDQDLVSDQTGIDCQYAVDPETGEIVETPSLTKQSFVEECDINVIVKRAGLLGELPRNVRMPTYGDFEGVSDYAQAMAAITEAEEAFMMMPPEVRARFNNDPQNLVDFCSDERNREEARKLGLVTAEEAIPAVPAGPGGAGAPVAPTPGSQVKETPATALPASTPAQAVF